MKKIVFFITLLSLALPCFAQFDIDYNEFDRNRREIQGTIESEINAQIRQQQKQAAKQQAVTNYNDKIRNEGQSRMEYYNNPQNYINRELTNRNSSLYNTNSQVNSSNGYNSPNQNRELKKDPVHSENLDSKSLQMLRDANRDYFMNEDRETAVDPNARVPLFDAPSLGVPLFDAPSLGEKPIASSVDQSQTPVEEMDIEDVYEELSPDDKVVYDKRKSEILNRQEFAEYQTQIAKIDAWYDGDFDGARSAHIRDLSQEYKAKKEIAKAKVELQELEKWAREAVRNNRNK